MTLYEKLQKNIFIIVGPCVIESREIVFTIADHIAQLQKKYSFTFIFKASFDKANRTSIHSFRGPGLKKGLEILGEVKTRFKLPILTDVHAVSQVEEVAKVVDILQIPAFLARQTDLLLAVGNSRKIVNIKKAQFLSSEDMQHVIEKIRSTSNRQILLTERGTMFGYNNLVVDFTGMIKLKEYGYPVIMDATHSTQKPGAAGHKSGGNRLYASYLTNAAAVIGIQGFFLETHPSPNQSLSDGANMIFLEKLESIIQNIEKISKLELKYT